MSAFAICLGLFAVLGFTCAQWGGNHWANRGHWGSGSGWGQQQTTGAATRATCRAGTAAMGIIEVDIRPMPSMSMWNDQGGLQMEVTVDAPAGMAATYKVVLTELGSVGNMDGCDNDNLGRIIQRSNRGGQSWSGRQRWGGHQGWGHQGGWGWGSMSTMPMDTMGVIGEIVINAAGDEETETFTMLPVDDISDLFGAGVALCTDVTEVSSMSSMSHWGWGEQPQTQYECMEPIPFCCTLARSDSAPN